MAKVEFWTPERDTYIRTALDNDLSVAEIADTLGCTKKRFYRRCHTLKINLFGRRADRTIKGLSEQPYWTPTQMRDMNDAFCEAMTIAIEKGKERAPIGVCTTPGTEYARMRQAYMMPPTQSVAAQCAAASIY